jgi:hypothetical protein
MGDLSLGFTRLGLTINLSCGDRFFSYCSLFVPRCQSRFFDNLEPQVLSRLRRGEPVIALQQAGMRVAINKIRGRRTL